MGASRLQQAGDILSRGTVLPIRSIMLSGPLLGTRRAGRPAGRTGLFLPANYLPIMFSRTPTPVAGFIEPCLSR